MPNNTPPTTDERFFRVVTHTEDTHAQQAASQTSLNEYGQMEYPMGYTPWHSEEHAHRSLHREW